MSEQRSLASTIYPDLPSGAPAASEPAPEPKAGPPESLAEKIYGSEPVDGLAQAKAGIEAGKARAMGEVAAETEAAPAETGPFGLPPGALTDKYSALIKENGLNETSAGKLVALHREALTEVSTKYWADQGTTWEKQSKAQFGERLPSMVNAVRPLLNDPRLTPPAFRALLEQYRIGSHPVLIDTLARWAARMNRR